MVGTRNSTENQTAHNMPFAIHIMQKCTDKDYWETDRMTIPINFSLYYSETHRGKYQDLLLNSRN